MNNTISLGIHECSFIDSFSDDKAFFFPHLKECGFSTVEFSILGNYSRERALRLRKDLESLDMRAACCTCLPEGASFVDGSESSYRRGIDYLKHCVDFCAALGADQLSGILYSSWGLSNPDISKQEKMERASAALRKAADYAAEEGVTFCLEVLNRYESDYINTLEEGRCFLLQVGRENVKLLADVFHMNMEEADTPAAIQANADIIGNIHVSENNRDFPGYGSIDWKAIITSVKLSGYTGRITYECATMHETEVGRAFNLWRSFSNNQNLEERLHESAAFIKKLL